MLNWYRCSLIAPRILLMLLLEKFLEQGQISLWGILRFLLKDFVHYQKDFHKNNNEHIQQCTITSS